MAQQDEGTSGGGLRLHRPDYKKGLKRLAEGDTYGTLLILIIAAYAAMALLENTKWARAITGALFGATLLLALHTSHVRGRVIRFVAVVVVVTVAWQTALAITDHEPFRGATVIGTLLVVATPLVILARIFRHPVINFETILGAIDAYLLVAIAYAAIYGALDVIDEPFFVQGPENGVKFLYFSFVVITTLGFGDLTPRTDIGRVIVSLEALLGQLFLVTIVAVLVANLGRAARSALSDPSPDTGDETDRPPASG
jgi:hypothetical protein